MGTDTHIYGYLIHDKDDSGEEMVFQQMALDN